MTPIELVSQRTNIQLRTTLPRIVYVCNYNIIEHQIIQKKTTLI